MRSVTNAEMPAFNPAGMIAALDVMAPSTAFKVDARGRVTAVGNSVRYPSAALGATGALAE